MQLKKKMSFLIICVPYRYKTDGMSDKAIVENRGMLKFVPDGYKNQKCVIKLLIIIQVH